MGGRGQPGEDQDGVILISRQGAPSLVADLNLSQTATAAHHKIGLSVIPRQVKDAGSRRRTVMRAGLEIGMSHARRPEFGAK